MNPLSLLQGSSIKDSTSVIQKTQTTFLENKFSNFDRTIEPPINFAMCPQSKMNDKDQKVLEGFMSGHVSVNRNRSRQCHMNNLLCQQLNDFGEYYQFYMTLKRKQVDNYKKVNADESILSLVKSSNVVDDFLSDMNSSNR